MRPNIPWGEVGAHMTSKQLNPSDFTNSKYIGKCAYLGASDQPIVVLESKSNTPKHWCVMYGRSQLFYLTLEEAMRAANAARGR